MKISMVLRGYWLDKQLDFSPNTVSSYQRVFHRMVAMLGDVEIESISSDDIRRFLTLLRIEYGLSKRSVHDAWIPLSSLWTWAERELGIPHIIRSRIAAPSYKKRTIDPFTVDEIQRLLKAVEYTQAWDTRTGKRARTKRSTADRDRAILYVLIDTGMRASELCSLLVSDYDAQRSRIHIREGKGDKERFVVTGSRAQRILWRYLAGRANVKPAQPLFTTHGNQAINRSQLYRLIARLGERANVPDSHPHRFRHTFAITFLRNGGSPLLLQELLGHAELSTVLTYVKLADQDMDGSAKHSPADNWKL
jgi:integrase/recombinase XerD